ncbi:MAG: ROK family protein, partial [Treponema sp.]|nr:ROK family protein [Treponema sp.]
MGVAMPGLIEKESGTVLFSPDFGWNNIPLQEWLGAKIPFPVMVENANRALTLNEVFLRGEDASHTWFWSTINKFDMRLDRTCHYAYSVSIAENNNIPGIAQKVSDGISPLLALRCDAPVSPQSLLTIENENLITTAVEQKEAGIAVRM